MLKNIKKYFSENDESLTKAAFYYILCQLLVKGMSFITTPIFTRMLTKAEYGNVSNFFAWQSLLIPLVTLNLRVTINRSKYLYPEDNDTFMSTILAVSNIITIIGLVFIELNQGFFTKLLSMDIIYIRILFLYIIFQTAFDYQQIQYNIYHKYKLYVFYTLLSVVFSLALSVVLVFFMNNKFEGRILGVTIPAILVDFIIYINILIKGRKVIPSYAKYAISMAVPLIPSALSSTILSTSDRIMITNFCGTEQTALYSVAYSVSSIAGILWSALNQAWGPWFYDRLNEKKYSEIEIFSNRFAMIYAGLVIGIMLISPEIVYIMGGKSYYDTIDVMPPVVLAMVFQFFYAFYFNAEYFYGETYIISIGTAIAAVVNIGLNFLLIPHFGYKAAAYTTMIGYMVMLIYHYLIVKYKLGKSFIYNNRFFVMLIVGMIILQVFIAILYHMIFIRYSIIILYFAIIGAIIWKNKNTLIILLNRIVKKNK